MKKRSNSLAPGPERPGADLEFSGLPIGSREGTGDRVPTAAADVLRNVLGVHRSLRSELALHPSAGLRGASKATVAGDAHGVEAAQAGGRVGREGEGPAVVQGNRAGRGLSC